jgi:Carboxypeptidase regulatory-like domain/TonB dependent receptor
MRLNLPQLFCLLKASTSQITFICNRTSLRLVSFCAAAILLGATAVAQVDTGQIAGNVTDESGAVVPGATVTVRNVSSNAQRTTQSSALGEYMIVGLEPGTYQVSVTSGQFKPFSGSVEVTVGSHVTLDAKLSISSNVTEVQVIAEGGTAVNTQTQELSQVVDTQQLMQLPSLTRNPYDFVVLSGNVSNGDNTTTNMNSGQNLSTRGVGYAVNGQRQSGTEILLDGVENISVFSQVVGQNIPIDSVQEYNVVTNNFAAEYGRASGGVVNLSSKSGSNAFHGGGWEYNRLSAYTANTYQNVATGLPKGVYTRNQFGFAAGGPIMKNKLFVFESTEWTRVRSQATQSELVPTPEFLSFTAPNTQSYFAQYGSTPYSISNTYAQSDIGVILAGVPASTPILGQINFKTYADAGGDYPQNTYRLLGRLDYDLSENTQMFFRIGKEEQTLFNGTAFYSPYPQYDVGSAVDNLSTLYSLSHSFTPSLFSSSKLSYNRLITTNSYDTTLQNTPNLMFGGATFNSLQITFPGLENFMAPGAGGLPFGGPQNTVQLVEDVSWTKGRHSMRYGFQGTYIQMNIAYGAYAQAVEYLQTGLQAGLQNMVDGNLQYFESAIDPQGQLPGGMITPPVTPPSFSRSYRYKDWAGYAQDSFKVSPRLNLNYGVRYEHYGVQHNNHQDLDSNMYYGPGSTLFEQIATGQVQIAPHSPVGQLWNPSWGTVAPRVGFAYDLRGDGKTSIRAGFGISYERNFGNVTFNMIQNPPAYGTVDTVDTPITNSNLGPLGSPGPPVPLPELELRNVNQNIRVAQTQFWSFAVQRELSRSSMIELSYSGAHGVHLYDITAGNPIGGAQAYLGAPPNIGSACTNGSISLSGACLTRNNSQYAAVNVRGSGGQSAYAALNVKYQAQDLHHTGLGIVSNYTWAHSLDDLSSTFSDSSQGGSGYIGNLGYLDPTHPMLDWASSDFDVPNRLVVSPIWQTPWFKHGHSVLTEVAGGWTVSGIYTVRSGTPFSFYDYTWNFNGYSGVPRLVPSSQITKFKAGSGVPVPNMPNQFQILSLPPALDAAPFNPTLGISDFGPFPNNMTGRNVFRGPGAWNFDMAAAKRFKLTERVGLEFRAEGFDLLNHHNLYTNEAALSYANPLTTPPTINPPLSVVALKGGLNSIALGGNHDERRFGQFSLRADF